MASPFFGGMAKTILKSWEARDADKRDVEKYKALEQLRRETSDYEFGRKAAYEATQTDKDLSYIDDDTGERILMNSSNQEVGRQKLTTAQKADRARERTKDQLDVDYKKGQIDNFAADNARADAQLGLQAAGIAESRADRADRRTERAIEREAAGGAKAPVYAKMNKILANVNSLEISPSAKLAARERITDAVNQGKGTKWLDDFEVQFYKGLRKGGAIDQYKAASTSDKILEQLLKDRAKASDTEY